MRNIILIFGGRAAGKTSVIKKIISKFNETKEVNKTYIKFGDTVIMGDYNKNNLCGVDYLNANEYRRRFREIIGKVNFKTMLVENWFIITRKNVEVYKELVKSEDLKIKLIYLRLPVEIQAQRLINRSGRCKVNKIKEVMEKQIRRCDRTWYRVIKSGLSEDHEEIFNFDSSKTADKILKEV
jgi:hypothetical protein